MKPFLLLSSRADDAVAASEYDAFRGYCGLPESGLRWVRLEQRPLGPVDLADFSGILLGGSPFCTTDPPAAKSPVQRRVEADLAGLLTAVVGADFPFLGACYGIGTLGHCIGAVVDRRYPEPVGATTITLTGPGRQDPVLGCLPESFEAFVGHKEAISSLPPGVVLLARSAASPVQAFRVKSHVYATQFHPELDDHGMRVRVDAYKDAGYFPPEHAEQVLAGAVTAGVLHPKAMLRAFAGRYARAAAGGRGGAASPREPGQLAPVHGQIAGS